MNDRLPKGWIELVDTDGKTFCIVASTILQIEKLDDGKSKIRWYGPNKYSAWWMNTKAPYEEVLRMVKEVLVG